MHQFFCYGLISILLFCGCQSAPTKLKEEVGALAEDNVVLVDTRTALEYSTYHVSGSVHLSSQDFLILNNVAKKTRMLDPDLEQVVERLARRGISPLKKIKLLADKKDSIELKKWQWLLQQLSVLQVEIYGLQDYIEVNRPLRPKPEPQRAEVWIVENKKNILEKSKFCFVSFDVINCK